MDNSLLDLYFEYFHRSHPFVLPKAALQAKMATEWPSVRPLVQVMQYIGSFYRDAFMWNGGFADIDAGAAVDGFAVQTTLLMALAKSMCVEQADSEQLLARAIQQAKDLGMHRKGFADAVSETDPVLAESWRRTWWMLYLVDANFAVIRHDFRPRLVDAEHDVDLPCEDRDYHATVSPQVL